MKSLIGGMLSALVNFDYMKVHHLALESKLGCNPCHALVSVVGLVMALIKVGLVSSKNIQRP